MAGPARRNRPPARTAPRPLVLCYLEGLTYGAAAQQLGLSEGTLRGRLAQARKRLRRRLTLRGVTIPAGLLAAGAATQSQAALPAPLVGSTIRIALGITSEHATAAMARQVINAMVFHQLEVAALVVLIGLGSCYWVWHALGAGSEKRGLVHAPLRQAASASAQTDKPQPKAPQPHRA